MRLALVFISISLLVISCCNQTTSDEPVSPKHHSWSPTPPMGWNSFDAYGSRINEEQLRYHIDYVAENLKPYGYNYVILDYIWFHDEPGNWNNPKRRYGHPDVQLDENRLPINDMNMDEYGRFIPSPVRFPSSVDGKGFKPLADYCHSKGLKFGIHIMRGIPRQAYRDNTPVLGTTFTARDIAEPWDTCNWMNHMWGVDGSKPGAQEYYNSMFTMFAEWGIDFIKADNMMFPEYHNDDIEMMRKAIDQSGRPMVFSVSNGEAPLAYGEHLRENTNLWRVSGDFWDYWAALKHNFDLLNQWSPFIGDGSWPDADMIPFGKVSLDGRPHGPERWTNFTIDEQYTLMNLWCIARSPLIIGSDLYSIDQQTLDLLTNAEIIAVNQNSSNNRQVYTKNGRIVWLADVPGTEADKYVALFNVSDAEMEVFFSFELLHLRHKYQVRDLWQHKDLGVFEKEYRAKLRPHASTMVRLTKVEIE